MTRSVCVTAVRFREEEPSGGDGTVVEDVTCFLRCLRMVHPTSGSGAEAEAPQAGEEEPQATPSLCNNHSMIS